MPRVLIVDDSATARLALRQALAADPQLEVVGEAQDGNSALAAVRALHPDIVTMDVRMRREDGVDVTARIMAERARPIVIVTSCNPKDPDLVYRALQAGALEVLAKLPGPLEADYAQRQRELVRTLTVLAAVPVVHRFRRGGGAPAPRTVTSGPSVAEAVPASPGEPMPSPRPDDTPRKPRALLVGASTGGPPVISSLLASLPAPFPIPIVVVQHIAEGFASGFASWLASTTGHSASVVTGPVQLRAGHVHVAPDDANLRLETNGLLVRRAPSGTGALPSIDILFKSSVESFGKRQIAVLMTGMGRDGTEGMAALHAAGANTFVQHPDTCAVGSMPSSVIAARAARRVLRPRDMPGAILAALAGAE